MMDFSSSFGFYFLKIVGQMIIPTLCNKVIFHEIFHRIIIGTCLIRKTMVYYIKRAFPRSLDSSTFPSTRNTRSVYQQHILVIMEKYQIVLLLFTVLWCTTLSDDQNSKLKSEINDLEMLVFCEIPCTNCSLDTWIKYLRSTLDKVLTTNSPDRSGNWLQKFVLGLAGQITGFGFNVILSGLGLYFSYRINKKFKKWEESEEIKFLRKLEWMQFPPTADKERYLLPERR